MLGVLASPDTAASRADHDDLLTLAVAARNRGDLTRALAIFEQVLNDQFLLLGGADSRVAATCHQIAAIHDERRAYREAEEYYARSLSILRSSNGDFSLLVADVLNDMAILSYNRADYRVARDRHELALSIRREILGETHPRVAVSLANLGSVQRSLGDFPGALERQSMAKAIRHAHFGETHPDVAASWNNLATAYSGMRAFDSAVMCHQRALAIRRSVRGETHPDVAASWNNLSVALRESGSLSSARRAAEKARAIWIASLGASHPFVASAAMNLGDLLRVLSDSAALSCYEEALSIWSDALGRHPSVARAWARIGVVLRDRHDLSGAERAFKEGLSLLEDGAEDGSRWRALPLTVELLYELSRTEERDTKLSRRDALRKALRHAVDAMDVLASLRVELSSAGRELQESRWRELPAHALRLEKTLESLGDTPDHATALRAIELASAWSFLELLAEARADLSGALPQRLADEERLLDEEARAGEAAAGDPVADIQRRLWRRRWTDFLARLRVEAPRYAAVRYPSPVSIDDIRSAMRPGEVCLSFLTAPDTSYLLAIARDTAALMSLAGESELSREFIAVRRSIAAREAPDTLLSRLYRLLFLPEARSFIAASGGESRLIISTFGPIEALPFEMLRAPDGGWLGDRVNIAYAPSLSIFTLLRRTPPRARDESERLLAFGDPVYPAAAAARDKESNRRASRYSESASSSWTPLPATRIEVGAIARLFPEQSRMVYLDSAASEASFHRGRGDLEYSYEHYACHGALEAGPGREPALILSLAGNETPFDGFLTLSEIVSHPHRTRITVLSACKTGLSSDRLPRSGVSSLARAFLMAGSDAVVVSLWPVDDVATARLMAEFYRAQRIDKASPVEALAIARRSLRARRTFAHPAYWAPFILVGAP